MRYLLLCSFSLLLATVLLLASEARAAGLPTGLGVDEAGEKKLGASVEALLKQLKSDKPDYEKMLAEIAAARKVILELAARVKNIEKANAPDTPTLPARTPLVVYGKVKPAAARKLLAEQLDYYVRSARGLLGGDIRYLREWTGRSAFRKPQRRIRSMVEILREAARTALLLSRPAEAVRVKKGRQLFADDFSKGAGKWLTYGQCVTSNEGDAFRLKDEKVAHPDAMMWTRRQFDGDFLAEFVFIPHTKGTRAGALFTICGLPRKGKKLDVCVGRTMNTYNYGIDGYHFSMHRGNTGLGNVRRVGPGLKLLMSGKDPCPTPRKAYRVAIGKVGPTIFLVVDGRMIHQYLDAATHGPVLTRGHIGLRHWAGLDASYKDFRVYRLVREGGRKVSMLIEPRGKVLFEEKFENLKNWRHEGAGDMVLDKEVKGAMRLQIVGSGQGKAGAQAFCLKDFPDGIAVEYEIKVLTDKGLVLNFVAMRGAKGKDMFDPKLPRREGIFNDYVRNPLLRSYHVSISRYGDKGVHTGVSNFRRNPGLVMMGQGPDLCRKIGNWYRVRLVKDGARLQLGVNGKLAHEFTDPLKLKTPVPDSGKVGFRAIGAEVRALVRNFRVSSLR
jgi:Domain of unknown function (DUF1961)